MVGSYLREMRRRSGKRVPAIITALGISRPTIYLWESKRSRIDPRDIRRLLAVYGCSEEEIAEALRLRSEPAAPPVGAS